MHPDICPEDTFHCSNGNCISPLLTCDGENNCDDGSDESAEHCVQGLIILYHYCLYKLTYNMKIKFIPLQIVVSSLLSSQSTILSQTLLKEMHWPFAHKKACVGQLPPWNKMNSTYFISENKIVGHEKSCSLRFV